MAKIPHEYYPQIADSEILTLCDRLVPNTVPILVSIHPWEKALSQECFENVARYAEERGGHRCLGWRIMRWANIMVEAEAHAVWCSPTGELLDITPCEQSAALFLPDPTMRHTGYSHANVRQALTDSGLVADLIDIANQLDQLRASVKSGTPYEVPAILLSQYKKIVDILQNTNVERNAPCPCKSGLKFKKCCGRF